MKIKHAKLPPFLMICLFVIFFINHTVIYGQVTDVVYTENFETGIGTWFADNGLWEVGIPAVGPENAYSGQQVAGTVLNGNYTSGANTRLISPNISLPAASEEEKILLKFWHWFRFHSASGRIQISVNSGEWQTITNLNFDGFSPNWTQYVADLTPFADSTVRIAFYFVSGSTSTVRQDGLS